MNAQPERVAQSADGALEPVGPSPIVKIVIALTLGNQSDWSRNLRSAGGGTIRIKGEDYGVTQPQVMSRQEAKPLVQAAFSPMERAGFRSWASSR
jgi:hypothetical protein